MEKYRKIQNAGLPHKIRHFKPSLFCRNTSLRKVKGVIFVGLMLLVTACQTKQVGTSEKLEVTEKQEKTEKLQTLEKLDAEEKSQVTEKSENVLSISEPIMQAEKVPDLESLLLRRLQLCQLEQSQREKMMDSYQGSLAHSFQLERLLIASCSIDYPPKLLKRELTIVIQDAFWPQTYQALFALMQTHIAAEENTFRKQQSVIDDMKKTIEALTKIEQDIESRKD